MNRRHFTKISLLGSAGFITGCSILSGKQSSLPTIRLSENGETLKDDLNGSFDIIRDLVSKKEEGIKIDYPTDSGREELIFRFVENDAAGYTHLRMQKGNGEVANVIWDREGLLPVVSFTDDSGAVLQKGSESLTYGFNDVINSFSDLTGDGLLELAWKLVAVGLVVWLGAKIAGAIIAAIAFLAFNVFVLGAVIIALEASFAILNWLTDHTGWSEADIEAFFDFVITELQRFLEEVSLFIENYT